MRLCGSKPNHRISRTNGSIVCFYLSYFLSWIPRGNLGNQAPLRNHFRKMCSNYSNESYSESIWYSKKLIMKNQALYRKKETSIQARKRRSVCGLKMAKNWQKKCPRRLIWMRCVLFFTEARNYVRIENVAGLAWPSDRDSALSILLLTIIQDLAAVSSPKVYQYQTASGESVLTNFTDSGCSVSIMNNSWQLNL